VLVNGISLAAGKVPAARNHPIVHPATAFLAPAISLIVALTSTALYYGVNTSATAYSLQTWTCQWSSISMSVKPHWGTLCKESKVALYLSILLIPIEVAILGTAAFGVFAEKKTLVVKERKGSPALS